MNRVRRVSLPLLTSGVMSMNLLAASTGQATLFEYEGFDYAAGSIAGQSGGTGWGANAWSGDLTIVPDSLTFPGLVPSTGGRILHSGNGTAVRTLGSSMSLSDTGGLPAYYISGLFRKSDDGRLNMEMQRASDGLARFRYVLREDELYEIGIASNALPGDVIATAGGGTPGTALDRNQYDVTLDASDTVWFPFIKDGGSFTPFSFEHMRGDIDADGDLDDDDEAALNALASGGTLYDNDTTYFFTMKIFKGQSLLEQPTLDLVHLKLYGPGDTIDSAETTQWDFIAGSNSSVTLQQLFIGSEGTGSIELDEIRIGTSWEDVVLLDTGLEGDLNGDGFVGIADLNIVLGVWNTNVTPGDLLAGDPSGDGFVGIADLNVVLGNWNLGTPPNEAATIPEPATLLLLGLSGLSLIGRSRGRR